MGRSNLTILIPSFNRSSFLIRLLRYFDSVQCSHKIAIADSSSASHVNAVKDYLANTSLNVRYDECPELNDSEAIRFLLDHCDTSYSVFVADDDFLVPRMLTECVAFLEKNPDYSCVHGDGILFNLRSSGAYGHIEGVSWYNQPDLEQNKPSQRLRYHLANYSVSLFSVHRTEQFRYHYHLIKGIKDKRFTELLPCCLDVISGKIKHLKGLYLIRQGHDQRYYLPQIFEWFTTDQWLHSKNIFCDVLAKELQKKENVLDAELFVNDAFKFYFYHAYAATHAKDDYDTWEHWRRKLSKISLMKDVYLFFKNRFRDHSLRLDGLLKGNNDLSKDFMGIYNVVMNQEELVAK